MIKVGYRLIPDGSDTIVEVRIDIDLTVATNAQTQQVAQRAVATLVSKLTDEAVEQVLERYQAGLWLADTARPEEPPAR